MQTDSAYEIILTGAGFTHNFGAPLARELWSWIFNHPSIDDYESLQRKMRDTFDYESIYHDVMQGDYSNEEKEAMRLAVMTAYHRLDEIARSFNPEHSAVNISIVQAQLLDKLALNDQRGFIFTLNQDLFPERNFFRGQKPYLPGIDQHKEWFTPNFRDRIGVHNSRKLPTKEELKHNMKLQNFNYIKLHGSWGWLRSSDQTDDTLVIGQGKAHTIESEPLLKWYFEIFKNVLFQPERRLLIIGYGFRDDHINKVLLEAIKHHKLKLYILCPMLPEDFKEMLRRSVAGGEEMWYGVCGFFPFTLEQMYEKNTFTQRGRLLAESFFDAYL